MVRPFGIAVMLVSFFSYGCDILGPGGRIVPGALSFYADPVLIAVPDTVRVASSFDVRATTYGGACLLKHRTEVRKTAMSAAVFVYDKDTGENGCILRLDFNQHTARLSFHQPGTATITFHGRRLPEDTLMTVHRTVVVR